MLFMPCVSKFQSWEQLTWIRYSRYLLFTLAYSPNCFGYQLKIFPLCVKIRSYIFTLFYLQIVNINFTLIEFLVWSIEIIKSFIFFFSESKHIIDNLSMIIMYNKYVAKTSGIYISDLINIVCNKIIWYYLRWHSRILSYTILR